MGPFWRPGAWAPEAAGADIGHPKISENHLENTGIPWIYMDLHGFTIHLWYFYHPFMVFLPSIYGIFMYFHVGLCDGMGTRYS